MRYVALILACLAATPAQAETVNVDIVGAPIALNIPPGYCVLDRQQAADNAVLTNMERVVATTNRVLTIFAECGQLEGIRKGERNVLDDFGGYMTPLRGNVLAMEPAEFARRMAELFKSQGAQMVQGAEVEIRKRVDSLELGIRVGEQKMIGVLRTDERATYLGIIQNLGLPDGSSKIQLALVSTGVIKQRIVSLNLYTRIQDRTGSANETVKLLGLATQTYTDLAAANAK